MLKVIEQKRNTLVDKGVSSGMESWKNTKRLDDRCDQSYKQDNRKERKNYRGIPLLSLPQKWYAKCSKSKC